MLISSSLYSPALKLRSDDPFCHPPIEAGTLWGSVTGVSGIAYPLMYRLVASYSWPAMSASLACAALVETATAFWSKGLLTTPFGSYAAFQHPAIPAFNRSSELAAETLMLPVLVLMPSRL